MFASDDKRLYKICNQMTICAAQQLASRGRKDYWWAKQSAISQPDGSLCLIVDGMDQNTTMVSKLRQSVKGIEGRYVKHICVECWCMDWHYIRMYG